MDETDIPQSPAEMFFILVGHRRRRHSRPDHRPAVQRTVQQGCGLCRQCDAQFEAEFRADIAVIASAVKTFGLPDNLKLSVHSGSDKFSIYPAINRATKDFGAGLHLKTAGTTWLEELIGLALADAEGLKLAKEIYRESLAHFEDCVPPYATVIDIDKAKLPDPRRRSPVGMASSFAAALRHDQSLPRRTTCISAS
jgi:tagaturonate epimerase